VKKAFVLRAAPPSALGHLIAGAKTRIGALVRGA
jgi:hypothetical protein